MVGDDLSSMHHQVSATGVWHYLHFHTFKEIQ